MSATKQFTSSQNIFMPALVVALCGFVIVSCGSSSNAEKPGSQNETENAVAAKPAFDVNTYSGPNFSLTAVDGSIVNFTDLLGKGPVALNFWGTWCGPCRREMPEFKRIWAEYESRGVLIVGVALRDTRQRVITYTTQQEITWLQVMGVPQTAIDYGNINGIPTTIIYSSQGRELSRYVGPMPYFLFKQRLDEALANEADQAT